MEEKNITLADVLLAVEEGFEKVVGKIDEMEKRLVKIESVLAEEDSQKEDIDRRLGHLESKIP